jgi:hypothetical protein
LQFLLHDSLVTEFVRKNIGPLGSCIELARLIVSAMEPNSLGTPSTYHIADVSTFDKNATC